LTAQVRTLLLHAAGFPSGRRTVYDTLRGEFSGIVEAVPAAFRRAVFTHRFFKGYSNLAYIGDWREAFLANPSLRIDACNINNILDFRRHMKRIADYELIVILHSAAGDSMTRLVGAIPAFNARKGKIVIFIANEYMLMKEKIRFAHETGAEFIASQLPAAAARWLYEPCQRSKVLHAPAALNPNVYRPLDLSRKADFGFRGTLYPPTLGDVERTRLIEAVRSLREPSDLTIDIQYTNVPREDWARFLATIKAIPGAESGTYFLERTDETLTAAAAYHRKNPKATFEDIFERFFARHTAPVSGKAISSRHFEPIGTKTCQLLLEGEYNGILKAGTHYVAVKKDLSNLRDAIDQVRDESHRRRIVEQAYELALSAHTYAHRVESVLKAVF
jgi:hypothetical protein